MNFLYRLNKKINFRLFFILKFVYFLIKKNYSKYPSYVIEFEKNIAKFFNSYFAITFSSGSAASLSAILSVKEKPNPIAWVSKLTFPSTIINLLNCNYRIVYLDFDKDFNPIMPYSNNKILPDLLILTHPFGFPVGYKFLIDFKKKFKNIKIIFDCSHTQGARMNNKNLNEYADITFISLQGSKAISGGEGGIILTDNKKYINRMVMLSHPGREKNKISSKLAGVSMSIKLRMHPLAALLANEDLKTIKKNNIELNCKFQLIYELLKKNKSISFPGIKNRNLGGFHYGLPLYLDRIIKKKSYNLPIKSYNWPYYEKNNFYNLGNFHSGSFSEKEKKYLKILKVKRNINDLRSRLLFIDLDWIKLNSVNYIKNNIDNFLKILK